MKKTLGKNIVNKHNGVYFLLVILLLIAGLYSPTFVQFKNLMTMLRQASALGILTIGQLFVIVGGGVDLSVAATLQTSITIFMYGYNNYGINGLIVGIGIALLFGLIVGIVNGIIVTKYHVQPFLTTLFTGSIITGIRMILVGIESAGNVPQIIRVFGQGVTFKIPNALIIFLVIAFISLVVLKKSIYGRKLKAVGTNFIAAKYSGIKANLTVIISYIISGILAVLGSIVLAGYIGFADRWIGAGYSFDSLIAAVIGGNYLTGGSGSVFGVVGGALMMTILINFVTLFGFSAPLQHAISGIVLILTLIIGSYSKNKYL